MHSVLSSLGSFNLEQRHADKLADFVNILEQDRFWHVLPAGESDPALASGLFDTQTGMLHPALHGLKLFFEQNPFVLIRRNSKDVGHATRSVREGLKDMISSFPMPLSALANQESWRKKTWPDGLQAILHVETRHLWSNEVKWLYDVKEVEQFLKKSLLMGVSGWELPSCEQLSGFVDSAANPCRDFLKKSEKTGILTKSDIPSVSRFAGIRFAGIMFACNTLFTRKSNAELLAFLVRMDWTLVTKIGEVFDSTPDMRWQNMSHEQLLVSLAREQVDLQSIGPESYRIAPEEQRVSGELAELDYRPCRQPKLDATQLGDPHKGLWELWGEAPATLARNGLVARDPGRDVKCRAVAIDFGTSSTVVAMETEHGGRELLRIGVRDFYQQIEARHFENPTVLECMDYSAFAEVWMSQTYRPALDWRWMRAAHEAQASFRDNPGDTQVLVSILPRLKQWALRSTEHERLRLTDRKGCEFELPPHTERNPVRGQPLQVAVEDPFDPIELYAWYLGMAINWRRRGLFLNYYLSFPVRYPREVRERILASFRRGLQRSLPQTLIDHYPECLHEFEVRDLASEPAAYAAAALARLGISPSEDGVPYAVFDFGGGTTDFDFGLLRWASPEEEARGYDQVFEHLASNGDNFLGGENLLEHLVYASFQHNLDELRRLRIQFTKPLDAPLFAGSEPFVEATQAAQTNSVMLAARLRPFLEGERAELPDQLKLDLIDANGSKQACELLFDAQALDTLLAARIHRGVEAFLAELARLHAELPAQETIHVLLAGNGSRSRHIAALFAGDSWNELLCEAFGGKPPDIVVHPPLAVDEADPYSPTAKTGVALGLLRLIPGENVLLLNHVHRRHDGQAPFAWHVGRMRRGRFEPAISPGMDYGRWQELGPLQDGVFNLFVSGSPRALLLVEGDSELKKYRLSFPAAATQSSLFARAVAPGKLELGAAPDVALINNSEIKSMELA